MRQEANRKSGKGGGAPFHRRYRLSQVYPDPCRTNGEETSLRASARVATIPLADRSIRAVRWRERMDRLVPAINRFVAHQQASLAVPRKRANFAVARNCGMASS